MRVDFPVQAYRPTFQSALGTANRDGLPVYFQCTVLPSLQYTRLTPCILYETARKAMSWPTNYYYQLSYNRVKLTGGKVSTMNGVHCTPVVKHIPGRWLVRLHHRAIALGIDPVAGTNPYCLINFITCRC